MVSFSILLSKENPNSVSESKCCEAGNVDERREGARRKGEGQETRKQIPVSVQRSADSSQEKKVSVCWIPLECVPLHISS